jgi:hypothetical protein
MSHSTCRKSSSSGVAMDDQVATSGAVVAAWCFCRLLVNVDPESLIAEEEVDSMA